MTSDRPEDEPKPPDPNHRFKAKRNNEQLKVFYGFTNALAAAIIVTALIAPAILGTAIASQGDQPGWVLIGAGLRVVGHVAVRFGLRSEE